MNLALLLVVALGVGSDGGCQLDLSPIDRELVDFLRTADIVEVEPFDIGSNPKWKIRLQRDGVVRKAVLRTVSKRYPTTDPRRFARDDAAFEAAAFELSRLLGITNVPPTVIRRVVIDGTVHEGSLQLWVDDAIDATQAAMTRTASHQLERRELQQQRLDLFDALIYNWDRHLGNVLFDQDERIWYIDHTRAFRDSGNLRTPEKLTHYDGTFHERLETLDWKKVSCRLKPYLAAREMSGLRRRAKALGHLLEELAKHDQRQTAEVGAP